MNREEILARSRNENIDEGFQDAANKGRRIGLSAFCCIFIVIMIFNFFTGQDSHAPEAMFWAFLSTEAYYKYRFTKEKIYLTTTIAGVIVTIASLANYIITVLG